MRLEDAEVDGQPTGTRARRDLAGRDSAVLEADVTSLTSGRVRGTHRAGQTMKQEMTSPDRRPQISLAQVAGSALAAVSAAVVASFLGVGGTVLGAAIGSMVATVGGAVYAHSFRRAGEQARRDQGPHRGHPQPGRATATPDPGDVPSSSRAASHGAGGPTPPYAESGTARPRPTEARPEPVVEAPQRPRWMRWQTGVVLAVDGVRDRDARRSRSSS